MKAALTKAAAVALLGMALGAAPLVSASASTDVIGSGLAHECATRTLAGESGMSVLNICDLAIEQEALDKSDLAKTYVNRGVVQLRRGSLEKCRADLASAEHMMPSLAEIYVNRGALYIRQKRFQDALDEINRGLALNPSEPEKAYYNRALAYELMGELKPAYLDYRKASELNPKWPEPAKAMSRFQVRRAGS
ncbi:MAG TPA: tetratricopeptide repeat protein [Caulobacterales bacterium]|jgi:tetratricopeptide (TPR) repeat protein|nr:tetratricopeptide repeat protein [Caulobacterales bacterium]